MEGFLSMRKIRTIKPEEDAYGQEVWAFYNGREVFEIVERDDGLSLLLLCLKCIFQGMKIGLCTKEWLWNL